MLLTPIENDNELTLEEILKGLTPDQIGGEIDWGDDAGAERDE